MDEGIEGKYTIGFPEEQTTPGLTGGEAFETQEVTISRSAFGGSVGHFVRVVHHEFIHVYQRGVLGFAGNLSIREVREFLGFPIYKSKVDKTTKFYDLKNNHFYNLEISLNNPKEILEKYFIAPETHLKKAKIFTGKIHSNRVPLIYQVYNNR